jgi:hypothetical protein
MCGSSKTQNNINAQQVAFMQQLQSQYQTDFAKNQSIFNDLSATLTPIIAAGPTQQGFSDQEMAALNTQARETAAQTASQTNQAINQQVMARGGGNNPNLTSPAMAMLDQQSDLSAENQLSQTLNQNTVEGFQQGNQNFRNAVGALAGIPGALESPLTSAGNGVVNSGNAAADEANKINSANNSWMGLLGGLAGTALGGPMGGGLAKGLGGLFKTTPTAPNASFLENL